MDHNLSYLRTPYARQKDLECYNRGITAKILKVEKKKSKYGDFFYYIFLKDENNGKSYRSCIYERMGNYARWQGLLAPGNILGNLRLVREGKSLIDADSYPQFIRNESLADPRD